MDSTRISPFQASEKGFKSTICLCTLLSFRYSGVATFVKHSCVYKPVKAVSGLSLSILEGKSDELDKISAEELLSFDKEGRSLVTDHGDFVLFNVYCPNETSIERLPFKMQFYMALEARVDELISAGKHVIIAGDINACRAEIDHADVDKATKSYNIANFGEHPARKWLAQVSFYCFFTPKIE